MEGTIVKFTDWQLRMLAHNRHCQLHRQVRTLRELLEETETRLNEFQREHAHLLEKGKRDNEEITSAS